MANKSVWSIWILLLGITVGLSGIVLAVVVPIVPPTIQDLFYQSFRPENSIAGMHTDDLRHIDWMYGVLGATMLGWGILITLLAYHYMNENQDWILGVMLASIASWYLLDTAISLHFKVPANILLNTVILLVALIPILLEKSRRRRSSRRA